MKTAYLSLGSNLGDRKANLERAISLLDSTDIRVVRRSPLYATEPRDFATQPWFLNTAVEIETTLFPRQLLSRIQKIERELGRRRNIPKGPRTVDIDILLFGNFIVDAPDLVIPHPRFPERRFVLAPLHDLNPELRHPQTRETVREMLEKTLGQMVRRLEYD
jgi:2-amino-4-hydroxy-6-hydroxymethyldihydropteridine diphosphokinase